jgi:hypothetical protein
VIERAFFGGRKGLRGDRWLLEVKGRSLVREEGAIYYFLMYIKKIRDRDFLIN